MVDLADKDERFWRWGNPMAWGIVLSGVVIAPFVVLAFLPVCEWGKCVSKWEHFVSAPPNEIGDTIAGLAGSLAFVWIIVTVWLQAIELKEQRKELIDQRKATEDMAKSLKVQAEIFKDEQTQRKQMQVAKHLEEIAKGIRQDIAETHSEIAMWVMDKKKSSGSGKLPLFADVHHVQTDEAFFRSRHKMIQGMAGKINLEARDDNIKVAPDKKGLRALFDKYQRITALLDDAAPDVCERYENMKFSEAHDVILSILEDGPWEVSKAS